MIKAGILFLLLFAVRSVRARQPAAPPGWPVFTQHVDAYAEASGVVGASALVMRDGQVLARHHYGYADRAVERPVDDRTLFHWASITKTLTAIAVMQLRDRGHLALDDPVTRWIPELHRVHNPYGSLDDVTVRMLLAHTAGFQGATWPWDKGLDWEPFEPTTWEQLVAMMPYQQVHFKPGSRYSYSNPAFIYLARIVEHITGDAWESYVQKNIFAPLGLSQSYVGSTPYYLAEHRSHGYYIRRDPATGQDALVDQGADFNPGITIPNSGWNAPLDDLAAYLAFLTGAAATPDAARRFDLVLSRQTLQEMWEPEARVGTGPTGDAQDMGLSFFIDHLPAQTVIGHTGDQAGYRSFMHFDPEQKTAFVLVFNTTNENETKAARDVFRTMMQAAFELLK